MSETGDSKFRFNLEFDSMTMGRVHRLLGTTDAASMAEVIRRAVAVTNFVTKEIEDGGELFLRNKLTGEEQRLIIL